MDDWVHSMFRDEMSSQARPSLDGMAEEVLAKGRRASRARTAKIASTVLVAVDRWPEGAAARVTCGQGSEQWVSCDGRGNLPAPCPSSQARQIRMGKDCRRWNDQNPSRS